MKMMMQNMIDFIEALEATNDQWFWGQSFTDQTNSEVRYQLAEKLVGSRLYIGYTKPKKPPKLKKEQIS